MTARENNLVVHEYLEFLFKQLPDIDSGDVKSIDELLPWSDSIPDYCQLKK